MHSKLLLRCFWILLMVILTSARIHKLEIRRDTRRYIPLSTFGFYKGGILNVNLTNFKAEPFAEKSVFGFSLYRMLSYTMHPSFDREMCLIPQDAANADQNKDENPAIYFTMDLKNLLLKVNCSENVHTVHIYKDSSMLFAYRNKRNSLPARFADTALFPRRKRSVLPSDAEKTTVTEKVYGPKPKGNICSHIKLPMTVENVKGEKYYNASFAMYIASEEEEGLYKLYFYNCPSYLFNDENQVALDFTVQISEINSGNFLSAGEMPLPALYFMMALLFFLSGCFWVFILKKSRHSVFKIHYLMAVLVYLKSLSLLFHGINYHFIQTKGEHIAAWAILYYITHLLKGAVLFITIVLIGTGWTFIKHILADKEKKLFVIVIPLQVLANVAEIIIEESEKGDIERKTWLHVFTLVDLLCCGAILIPVVWSIRHLKQAADTDGKAAVNLRKLKLFKHFYLMIVCYIYFTRVIVDLLKKTVPFQYEWLDEMFREMATYVFFVLTGYKFRPASANPYFTVPNEEAEKGNDDDDDMDVVVSGGSGVTEGLSKVSKVVKPSPTDVLSNPEERDSLLNKRESSHEYD